MSSDDRNGTQSGIGGADGGASTNGDGHATEDGPAIIPRDPVTAGAAADGPAPFAVDDPDEPTNPDEATRANVEAARSSLRSRAPRRPPRGPMGWIALVVILGCSMAMLLYAARTFMTIKDEAEVGELRRLEQRDYIAPRQQRFTGLTGRKAPFNLFNPLSAEESARMAELRAIHGRIYKPADDDEAGAIDAQLAELNVGPTTAAATTGPADPAEERAELRGLEQQEYMAPRVAQVRKLTTEKVPVLDYVPLSRAEAQRMAALRQKHGPQYKPAEDDDAMRIDARLRELTAAATQPTTTAPTTSPSP